MSTITQKLVHISFKNYSSANYKYTVSRDVNEATTHEAESEAEATTHEAEAEAEATTHEAEAEAEAEAKTHLEILIIII